ncbi:MAG TPA: alpha/beta fold hydrolase [Candidatus Aquicultor sp.]|jgi:pimeloyl-ACP methyl ester carboxylesterase
MKALVVFDSNYGNTQKIAEAIAKELGAKAATFDTRVKLFVQGDAMTKIASELKRAGATMTDILSIYKNSEGKSRCMALYEKALERWPVSYEQLDLPTRFGTTHIIVSGQKNAPPLILLHGQWASAMMWSSAIGELSKSHLVYALDQIDDVGRSNPTHPPNSRSDYAEWLLDLFDQLKIRQADVAGLSYGGFLAVNFALNSPDRVKQLILLCPGVPSFGPPTLKWALHGIPMIYFPSRLTAKWLVRGMTAKGHCSKEPEAERIMAGAMCLRSRIPFRPMFSDDEFANLKMPVLLLVGEGEAMYNAQSAVDRALQLIPHIEAEIIPDAGHMLISDQPEIVINRIAQFLRNNRIK